MGARISHYPGGPEIGSFPTRRPLRLGMLGADDRGTCRAQHCLDPKSTSALAGRLRLGERGRGGENGGPDAKACDAGRESVHGRDRDDSGSLHDGVVGQGLRPCRSWSTHFSNLADQCRNCNAAPRGNDPSYSRGVIARCDRGTHSSAQSTPVCHGSRALATVVWRRANRRRNHDPAGCLDRCGRTRRVRSSRRSFRGAANQALRMGRGTACPRSALGRP